MQSQKGQAAIQQPPAQAQEQQQQGQKKRVRQYGPPIVYRLQDMQISEDLQGLLRRDHLKQTKEHKKPRSSVGGSNNPRTLSEMAVM